MDIQPADQQGEPVAWLVTLIDDGSTYCITEDKLRADRLIADSDYVITPLYRNAQPATAKVDERAEFDKFTVQRGNTIGYYGWQSDFAIWQARAKLNGGRS